MQSQHFSVGEYFWDSFADAGFAGTPVWDDEAAVQSNVTEVVMVLKCMCGMTLLLWILIVSVHG